MGDVRSRGNPMRNFLKEQLGRSAFLLGGSPFRWLNREVQAEVFTPTTIPPAKRGVLRYGVIGSPISHSLSPPMQLAGWQALGIPAEYFRIEIPSGELEKAVPQLIQAGLAGWNCTLPHKGEMFRLSQIKDSSALEAESVNTVQILNGKIHGSSTDALGWARAITETWPNSLPPGRVLLLGCGGVGQSIARFLARTGCDSLTLVNRDPLRAQRLLRELTPLVAGRFPIRQMDWDPSALRNALKETDLLLHGTSLGLKETDPSPIPEEHLNPPMRIYDTLYRKDLTPLVRAGRKRGCLAIDGLGMLLHQGALSFELWSKKPAPLQPMRAALEQVAGRNL